MQRPRAARSPAASGCRAMVFACAGGVVRMAGASVGDWRPYFSRIGRIVRHRKTVLSVTSGIVDFRLRSVRSECRECGTCEDRCRRKRAAVRLLEVPRSAWFERVLVLLRIDREISVRNHLPETGPSGASHKWFLTLFSRTLLSITAYRRGDGWASAGAVVDWGEKIMDRMRSAQGFSGSTLVPVDDGKTAVRQPPAGIDRAT